MSGNPLWILLTSWSSLDPRDFPGRDFTVNIALYVPLGISGYLTLKTQKTAVSIGVPVLIAIALSSMIEMLQIYYPLRYCSMVDLVANVLGASIGVAAARVFRETVQVLGDGWQFRSSPEPVPLLILFSWATYMLFPFVPVLGRTALTEKFALFATDPLRVTEIVAGAIVFFIVGGLFTAAGLSAPGAWLWAATLLIPAEVMVVTRQPAAAYFLGAVFGCLCFVALAKRRRAQQIACWAFFGLVVLRGLSPFAVQSVINDFSWIPFARLIEAEDGQHGLLIVLDKVCHYGTAIWAMRTAGFRLRTAIVLVATTLACIEIIQIRLPGRTPETTDPIMATMLGVAFRAIEREKRLAPRRPLLTGSLQ